jgi:hypothetical protein
MCIVQSANIVGNLISAVLIERLGQEMYAIVMLGAVFTVSLGFLMVKEYKYVDKNNNNDKHKNNYDIINTVNKSP